MPGKIKTAVGFLIGFLILFGFVFPGRKKAMIAQLVMVYLLMNILLGGTIALIQKMTGIPVNTIQIITGTGGAAIIFKVITTIMKKSGRDMGCEVCLGYRGKEIFLHGMIDSGNSLTEPFSKKAVTQSSSRGLHSQKV